MSVESITKPVPASALSRGTGRAHPGLHQGRGRTRPGSTAGTAATPVASGQRVRASRAWFLGIVLGLLGAGLVGLLLLNTASAQDAFRLHDLQMRAADLSRQEQSLSLQASVLADPGTLSGRAGQLGMVPGGDPQFLAPGAPLPAGCQPTADGCVVPAPKTTSQPPAQTTPKPTSRVAKTQAAGNPGVLNQPTAHRGTSTTTTPTTTRPTATRPTATRPNKTAPKVQPTPTRAPIHAGTQQPIPRQAPSRAPAPAQSVPAHPGVR
ncbi:MAG: hypothetical protein ACXVHC_06345 [Frankiaceae bacterium]